MPITSKNIIAYLKIKQKHTTITTLPFSYVYGLSVINTHLYKGASIVLNSESVLQKIFCENLLKYKVNSFAGVPYTYEILDKLNFYDKNIPSLLYTTQAGGKLNSILWEKL